MPVVVKIPPPGDVTPLLMQLLVVVLCLLAYPVQPFNYVTTHLKLLPCLHKSYLMSSCVFSVHMYMLRLVSFAKFLDLSFIDSIGRAKFGNSIFVAIDF